MLDCCKKNKWFYFGLTIPSMLLYVLALAGPLLLGTLPASFYNWNLIKGNKDFVGLGNYTKLLGDEPFIHSVVFTLILAVISILMSNLIGFVIAYFLDSNVRCKGVIRSLFFIPNIISGVMVSFVWSFIFTGAIPNLAKILHVDALANISWFGNAGTAAICGFYSYFSNNMAVYRFSYDVIHYRIADNTKRCVGSSCSGWMYRN